MSFNLNHDEKFKCIVLIFRCPPTRSVAVRATSKEFEKQILVTKFEGII